MKKMQTKIKTFAYRTTVIGYCLLVIGMVACQEHEWDNYYGDGEAAVGMTLMQAIDANPDLSQFAQIARRAGLAGLLASSQSLTVFAPTNEAMAQFSLQGDTLSQFLYNHICRYTHSLGDVAQADDGMLRIKMLNGKYQTLTAAGDQLRLADLTAATNPQGASNGVLFTIGEAIPFYNNIYEEIKRTDGCTSRMADYLSLFDEYTFNPEKSTVLGVNDRDETVYDSVFNFRNDWMRRFGDIYLEDSVYTMLVPTDQAFQKQYDRIARYFRTYGEGTLRNPASGLNITGTFDRGTAYSDSLTHAHTLEMLTHDLVFRKSIEVDNVPGDSIVSTSGHVFHHPARLFAGAGKRGVSNGQMYVTDHLSFDPRESWHEEIRVEAEDASNYATQYAGSTQSASAANYPQFAGSVSEDGFLIVNPTQLSFQRTTIRFRLPQTLAAAYNIYIVTVPESAVDTTKIDSESLRGTRLKFYLRYVHEDGELKEDASIDTPTDFGGGQVPTPIDADKPAFITNARQVDKMLIARNFRFPFANYTASAFKPSSEDVPTTAFLRVESDVTTAAALAEFEKTMRIDCIILEPVSEE